MALHKTSAAPPADELDDLYSYDVNMDDAFRDFDTNMYVPAVERSSTTSKTSKNAPDLGIEEVVQVAKKRVHVAKLDETRFVERTLHD